MPAITISIPPLNTDAYFKFKEPMVSYIKSSNKINIDTTRFKVISLTSMADLIRNNLVDPYSEIYDPAGIPEYEYKKDLLDNVPIATLSYVNFKNIVSYIRLPVNYIESISNFNNIEYIDKNIVINLGKLSSNYDTSLFFDELKDFIYDRTGVTPSVIEVAIGAPVNISKEEHAIREQIRSNKVTVTKSLATRYEELNIKYNDLLRRLAEIGITLI